MTEQEPGPSQNPYGQPQNPYGQPTDPYGQPSTPTPYGSSPQPAYASAITPMGGKGARPTTVTAAAWITMVISGLSAALYAVVALFFLVASDAIVTEMEKMQEIQDADIDPGSIVGVMVVVMLGLTLWSIISLVLGVFVLRRSNVARILLVVSSVVVALGSLLGIASGISALWLIAAVAVIVLLFVGGAGDWFNRRSDLPGGPGAGGYAGGYQTPYGQTPYGDQPYGGGSGSQGGADYPPSDYPGR